MQIAGGQNLLTRDGCNSLLQINTFRKRFGSAMAPFSAQGGHPKDRDPGYRWISTARNKEGVDEGIGLYPGFRWNGNRDTRLVVNER
jgi:hypothetical protein